MTHFERPPILPHIVEDQDVALNADAVREAAFWSTREREPAGLAEVEATLDAIAALPPYQREVLS